MNIKWIFLRILQGADTLKITFNWNFYIGCGKNENQISVIITKNIEILKNMNENKDLKCIINVSNFHKNIEHTGKFEI